MNAYGAKTFRVVVALILSIAMSALAFGQEDTSQNRERAQTEELPRFEEPDGRFSVPIPTDWQSEQRDGFGVLTSPDGGIEIYVLALDEENLDTAIEQAWQRVDSDFDLPVGQTQTPPPSGDIEEVLVISYDTAQDRIVQGVAQLFDGTAYLILIDAELGAVQQRTSQVQIVQSGFRIAAIQETDLSGQAPAEIGTDLLADLDTYIQDSLETFAVPGASVAIVHRGDIVWAARSRVLRGA